MLAGIKLQTLHHAHCFVKRQVAALAVTFQHAERVLAAYLAAGQIHIFVVVVVAENDAG